MGNLLTSLLNSTNALKTYTQGLEVVQNDVTNSSTPGYVKQIPTFEALPFDISVGLPGGVSAGPVQNARDAFAEKNVRDHQSALGFSQQQTSALNGVEANFSLSSKSGVAPAINALFQSFSSLSVNPSDPTARQAVVDQANHVAQAFHGAVTGLATSSQNVDGQTRSTISEINRLAGKIRQLNAQRTVNAKGGVDAGIDAQLNSTLEDLSQYGDFTALQQPDGKVNLYLGGQTPVVLGNQSFAIQGDFSTPQTKILDSQGQDITGQITAGQLRGQLAVKNSLLPSYTTDLNTLAQTLADQVNSNLAQGVDANGATPTTALFSYNATTGAAATVGVTSLTPDQIAAASPSAPGGNGNALNLAALGDANVVNGSTFTQFYGALAGRVGRDLSSAQDTQDTQQQLLIQAQNLRKQTSGVSLDEEATRLIEFQRAYQATSKLIGVLDSLTQTTIDIIH
ncbi:MAG: flagellar hook-associated protein FlgK [Bryobacteraceae bacterium]